VNHAEPVGEPIVRETLVDDGFIVGLDLGQARDYTAISIVDKRVITREIAQQYGFESTHRVSTTRVNHFRMGHLERLRLGTSYPDVAAYVGTLLKGLPARPRPPALVVDSTGVGRPVVDMLRAARLRPVAVTITGGNFSTEGFAAELSVPKRDLVSTLAVVFQSGRLKISSRLAAGQQLVDELIGFRVRVSARGHDSYGSETESIHDDLVIATALAVYFAEREPPRPPRRISLPMIPR
jgi:hypothetical protein